MISGLIFGSDIGTDVQLLFIQVLHRVGTTILLTRTVIAATEKWMLMICAILKKNILTANVGFYARFPANMLDWTDMSQAAFIQAFSALPLPLGGPPTPGCSMLEVIQASISIF